MIKKLNIGLTGRELCFDGNNCSGVCCSAQFTRSGTCTFPVFPKGVQKEEAPVSSRTTIHKTADTELFNFFLLEFKVKACTVKI